jgi:uncharacterized protein YjcR
MTEVQQEKIKALRWRGTTYASIAAAVDLSPDTVKSYCRRNGITILNQEKAEGKTVYAFCENCGVPIEQAHKQKPKKFCCEECRSVWWNKNRRLVSGSLRVAHCAHCGAAFEKYANAKQRYCGKACYINHRFGEVPTT